MKIITRLLVAGVFGAIAMGLTGCNGNIDPADNCSLVLAAAVEYEQVPDLGWTLWDAYGSNILSGSRLYACRGLTLAYGGMFIVYFVQDRDAIMGGDGGYQIWAGPYYETERYDMTGTAVFCSGHRVAAHSPGDTCQDLE
jgi:hypothetical protein